MKEAIKTFLVEHTAIQIIVQYVIFFGGSILLFAIGDMTGDFIEKRKVNHMDEFYATNEDFSEYVDRYCKKHEITVQEALKHKIVKHYFEWLGGKHEGERISSTGKKD